MRHAVLCFASVAASLTLTDYSVWAAPAETVLAGNVRLDRTEVTVGAFRAFAASAGLRTAAERDGGGFEFVAGWRRRANWSYLRPYGDSTGTDDEPAVHVSWSEAQAFCATARR